MWRRLAALLETLGVLQETTPKDDRGDVETLPDPEIDFRDVKPADAANGDTLVCPVTRMALRESRLLYVCRDCNTMYSAEGWAFLRETDKGRCCHCRHIGSVVPFHARGDQP